MLPLPCANEYVLVGPIAQEFTTFGQQNEENAAGTFDAWWLVAGKASWHAGLPAQRPSVRAVSAPVPVEDGSEERSCYLYREPFIKALWHSWVHVWEWDTVGEHADWVDARALMRIVQER